MGISLLKWKFQQVDNMYYITSRVNDTTIYLSSTYSTLKPNPRVKCLTPIRMVQISHNITPFLKTSLFNPNKWEISNKGIDKHTFYIRQKFNNSYIYLSVCYDTGALMMTSVKYEWNIINLNKIHQFHIHQNDEYVIVDFKSTKALNIEDEILTLSPTYFWRLGGNPMKVSGGYKEPLYDNINKLFQHTGKFFVYSNVNKNQSIGNIYLGVKGTMVENSISGWMLRGIEFNKTISCDLSQGLLMCDKSRASKAGIELLKWSFIKNSIVNSRDPTYANLTYLPEGNIFYTIKTPNSDWNITNLIRKNGYRFNDLIIIDAKVNGLEKTLIIDSDTGFVPQTRSYKSFKLIQTPQLDISHDSNIMESCSNTNILDLYIGKYNTINTQVDELEDTLKTANTLLKNNEIEIDKKTSQLTTLNRNIGEQITTAHNTHHSELVLTGLQDKLKTNSKLILDEINKLRQGSESSKSNINSIESQITNMKLQRDKWQLTIQNYDTECNTLYDNTRRENESIAQYKNNKLGNKTDNQDIEYFSSSPTPSDMGLQIKNQSYIIKEKNNLINTRIDMLSDITRTNKVKVNIIYISGSIILLITFIIVMLYVKNNKIYIIKPEM